MSDPQIPKRKFNPEDLPRSFMTPAYIEEADPGTFVMFRDILIETDERDENGERLREKFGKRIGPIAVLREAAADEQPDFTTSRPDGTVLLLKRIDLEKR